MTSLDDQSPSEFATTSAIDVDNMSNHAESNQQQQESASATKIVYPDPNNPYKCISNGIPLSWNQASQQWLPDVEVDEDFLAYYNATYGVPYDYASMAKPEPERHLMKADAGAKLSDLNKKELKKMTKEEKMIKKREAKKRKAEAEAAKRKQGWFQMDDDHNTTVYASGFPPTVTDEEFLEFMQKCGIIMKDPRTGKPKIKLYKTETGEPKGDGTCCYIKMESVELALQILDGWQWDNAHKIKVDFAKFELKGEYDPEKAKKARLSEKQKKKFLEKQQKLFEWKPDKPRNFRPRCECTVVLKGVFTLEHIDQAADRIFRLKEDTQKLCERFGPVNKLVLYDTNPEGVVTVTFDNVEHADQTVQALNGRIVAGQIIQATHWDGHTKFKREETEQERQRRENAWTDFLGNEDVEKDHICQPETEEKTKAGPSEEGHQEERIESGDGC